MIRAIKKYFERKRLWNHEISPDEIFLDARNLPNFDVDQFEGRLEKPISKNVVLILGVFFLGVGLLFTGKVVALQVVDGESYALRSENNRLQHTPIFSSRGIIYDRNGKELVWNEPGKRIFPGRAYTGKKGLAHVLGYVSYPAVDASGFYYQTEFTGKDGVEKFYNARLSGENGLNIVETDALMNVRSESVVKPPRDGEDITLSIDADVQSALYTFIGSVAYERDFQGGAGVILDVQSGEIIALTSFPEYDSNILSAGSDQQAIARFLADPQKPFLNKAVSGLYTPGSTVKPFVAIGALMEGVITPEKKILSTGSISIPNPYFPEQKSVFMDWKAHGWVDMRDALAVSSNVYFYEIGGGFQEQKGLGISKIKEYVERFGLGKLTGIDISGDTEGVIPDPEWKAARFDGEPWRLGDTYHTAIGQYGFQVTPLQLVRGIAAIANKGTLVTPHLIKGSPQETVAMEGIKENMFAVVVQGMRQAVTEGSAKGLDMPQVRIAAKTGTAEVGTSKKRVNSWVEGFFPEEAPRYAFVVVMEKGPRENTVGALFAIRQTIEWMAIHTPEYLKAGSQPL